MSKNLEARLLIAIVTACSLPAGTAFAAEPGNDVHFRIDVRDLDLGSRALSGVQVTWIDAGIVFELTDSDADGVWTAVGPRPEQLDHGWARFALQYTLDDEPIRELVTALGGAHIAVLEPAADIRRPIAMQYREGYGFVAATGEIRVDDFRSASFAVAAESSQNLARDMAVWSFVLKDMAGALRAIRLPRLRSGRDVVELDRIVALQLAREGDFERARSILSSGRVEASPTIAELYDVAYYELEILDQSSAALAARSLLDLRDTGRTLTGALWAANALATYYARVPEGKRRAVDQLEYIRAIRPNRMSDDPESVEDLFSLLDDRGKVSLLRGLMANYRFLGEHRLANAVSKEIERLETPQNARRQRNLRFAGSLARGEFDDVLDELSFVSATSDSAPDVALKARALYGARRLTAARELLSEFLRRNPGERHQEIQSLLASLR